MASMMHGTKSGRVYCSWGCCRDYSKKDRQRKRIDGMYRAREKRQWKKENQ